jgi:hypothetical protein
MRVAGFGVIVLGVVLVIAPWARAKPSRSGFTGDLGVGVAVTFAQSANLSNCVNNVCGPGAFVTKNRGELGFAPLSVSLGGFVSRRIAILGRSAGTAFIRDGDVFSYDFLGPIVEVWPVDVFYFSAGPGLAVASRNGYFLGTGEDKTVGWALDLRGGFALLQKTNNDLTLSLELIPSFYRNGDLRSHATGCAFVAAWKWY